MTFRHFGSSDSSDTYPGIEVNGRHQMQMDSALLSPGSTDSGSRKANLTSYKVFAEFFRVPSKEKEGIYEEQILTKDCYKRWLGTRKGKLLHPEGSFRRTVLAHLRGADGRKPFPAEVEISLLKKLRERDSCDRLLNPWTVCFETPESNLEQGCRKRFTALGYHEGLVKKGKKSCPPGTYEMPRVAKMKPEPISNNFNQMVLLDSANFQHKMHVAKMHEVEVCLPAVSFMLNNFASEDARLARDFIFPPAHECYFEPHISLFELNVNGADWIVNSGDGNAERILGNVAGMHLTKIFPSLVEFFNVARLAKEMTAGNGFNKDMWIRSRCIGLDGKLYSILACFKLTGNPTSIPVLCQDQTLLGKELSRTQSSERLPPLLV